MKLNKFDYIIIYTLGILLIFTVSFNVAMSFYGNRNKVQSNETIMGDKLTSSSGVEKFLSEDMVVLLQLKNNNTIINTKTILIKELKSNLPSDLTLSALKDYYLGVTRDDFIAIFKCDNEGNLFIEDPINDVSNRDIETLPTKDREYLKNYEYEFDTKEEANDELMALIS